MKIFYLISVLLLFTSNVCFSQLDGGKEGSSESCIFFNTEMESSSTRLSLNESMVTQSSTFYANTAYLGFDSNMNSYARTETESNPFITVDLGNSRFLSSASFRFCLENDLSQVSDFYILTSDFEFIVDDLDQNLMNSCVASYRIENYSSDSEINLGGISANFIRIQRSDNSSICLVDGNINVVGVVDCLPDNDGLVDCDDSDCGINVSNVYTTPSSIFCEDGTVTVQAFSDSDITYFINGTEVDCDLSLCEFELEPGDYTFTLQNQYCTESFDITVDVGFEEGEESLCPNGSFESGNFENWTIHTSVNEVDNTDCNPYFTLQQNGTFSDPYIPSADPIITSSDYFAVIGNNPLSGGFNETTLSTCFTVTEDNSNFCFSYALVLENPEGHSDDDLPFFEWTILDNNSEIFAGEKITSNDDSFFEYSGLIAYQGFQCESVDLSGMIGEEVCIEFLVAECGLGDHGAYAYIDGICQECSSVTPVCDISIPNEICAGQNIPFEFSATTNFNQFSLQICDSYSCTELSSGEGFSLNDLNLTDLADQAGFLLECDEEYQMIIELTNNCGMCTSDGSFFTYNCELMSAEYPDCIVACSALTGFAIPSNFDCPNCEYVWEPSNYFEDAFVQNPIFNTSILDEALFLNRSYNVIVTIPSTDCIVEEEVFINQRPILDFQVDSEIGYCSYMVNVDIKISDANDIAEKVLLSIVDNLSQESYSVVLDAEGLTDSGLSYSFEVARDLDTQISVTAEYVQEHCSAVGDCSRSVDLNMVTASEGNGQWRVYLPNIFSPNNDGINDTWNSFFASLPLGGGSCDFQTDYTSVDYFEVRIYDRWGERVFTGSASDASSPGLGLFGTEVVWDGWFNGSPLPAGVYALYMTVESCVDGSTDPDCNIADYCIFCSRPGMSEEIVSEITIVN